MQGVEGSNPSSSTTRNPGTAWVSDASGGSPGDCCLLQPHKNPTSCGVKCLSGSFVHAGEGVSVDIEGGLDGTVAEAFLNHFGVLSGTNEKCCGTMAEVVECAGFTY